jgi:hypothetical protein
VRERCGCEEEIGASPHSAAQRIGRADLWLYTPSSPSTPGQPGPMAARGAYAGRKRWTRGISAPAIETQRVIFIGGLIGGPG